MTDKRLTEEIMMSREALEVLVTHLRLKGDPPPEVRWFHDKEKLAKYVSILKEFDKVQAEFAQRVSALMK